MRNKSPTTSSPAVESNTVAVSFQEVGKYFGKFQALKDINLTVPKGQKLIVLGPSGSGKSTLIRCINGIETYDEGSLHVDGLLVSRDERQLLKVRQRVGMVFQQFNLFPHMTILQNCMIGQVKGRGLSEKEAKERAEDALNRVHILDQKDKYPVGLSGGQQQRAAIARALCAQPDILLFDEPTSALDPEMVYEVLDVMQLLAKTGMTMICVTHEMGFARSVADRMVFMDEGRILQDDTPEAMFSNPNSDRVQNFFSRILSHEV